MRVKDIMNKNIIVIDINTSIYDACNTMKKFNIGFLPVSFENKILGVITDRDIVINCISNNCENDQRVMDYINKNVISINYNEEVENALNLMKQHKVKRLLVSNDEKVVGILSISDLLNTDSIKDHLLETIRSIWSVKDNIHNSDAEIDEFYL